jgi:hypothetical protein
MAKKKATKNTDRAAFILSPNVPPDAGPDAPGIRWSAEIHLEDGSVVYEEPTVDCSYSYIREAAEHEAEKLHRDAVECNRPNMDWAYIRIIRVAPKV